MEKLKNAYLAAIFFIIAMLYPTSSHAEAVGTWTIYPSYYNIENIEMAGHDIFVLASSNLYSYNTDDESLTTYTKTTCLSDVNVSKISWNSSTKRLVVVYNSYNIDILSANGDVINIPDLKTKQMTGDKTINNITQDGQYAYLATNFGVVKIDVKNGYIADSYILNKPVKQLALLNGYIYGLTTQNGVIRANMSDNMNDPASWKAFSPVFFEYLFAFNGHLIGMTNGNANSINTETGAITTFGLFPFTWVKKCNDRIICGTGNNVTDISADLTCRTYSAAHTLNVVTYDDSKAVYWSNNNDNKLTRFVLHDNELMPQTTGAIPDGPASNDTYRMVHDGKKLILTPGGWSFTIGNRNNKGNVLCFEDGKWSEYEHEGPIISAAGRYQDVNSVAIDPKNPSHVFASAYTGLYEFYDGKFHKRWGSADGLYLYDNNPNKEYHVIVTGLKYDSKGNLWILNSHAPYPLFMMTPNRELKNLALGNKEMSRDEAFDLEGITIDGNNVWFGNEKNPEHQLFRYDIEKDELYSTDKFINQDGKAFTIEGIYDTQKDRKGNIWVATSSGPLYLTPEGANSWSFIQHKVPRNDGTNYADYLLDGISVRKIAIDGANRKWIGTERNGVFLISDDCNTQIAHFTTENSPLLSNMIFDIVIDNVSGRVYIATDKGLCSYMSDATSNSDDMSDNSVWAYPNPVTPDFTGDITITGLEFNSQVTITTASGQEVTKGRSNGGSYTWNGCDSHGRRVASGIYMVLVAKENGDSGIATKIAIVR